MTPTPVLILHAPGTNRDGDAAEAVRLAGGEPCIMPLTQLRQEKTAWLRFGLLVLPGGFSYGDALGAGRLWALSLQTWLSDQLQAFIQSGRPVIGICNGFQTLVKAGILPGPGSFEAPTTLTFNAHGRFECRWVTLHTGPANPSPWLAGINEIFCPVAHGEGRFLWSSDQPLPADSIAFTYASSEYPANPNGSVSNIAGITNRAGNVLGLMPHPEDHIYPYQHPYWTRGAAGGLGLPLFQNGLRLAQAS